MKKQNYTNWIIGAGVILFGAVFYYAVLPYLKLLKSGTDGATNNKTEDKVNKQNEKAFDNLANGYPIRNGITATKTAAEWSLIAQTIADLLTGFQLPFGNTAETAAYQQIIRVKNDADFMVLSEQFKERRLFTVFGYSFGEAYNLQTVIAKYLSAHRNNLNNNFATKKMKTRV